MTTDKTEALRTTMTTKPDFIVEFNHARGVVYYTPNTPAAFDWCNGTGEGNRSANMKDVPMFGRSFVLRSDNPRANKLRGYLKGVKTADRPEGFLVQTIGQPGKGA